MQKNKKMSLKQPIVDEKAKENFVNEPENRIAKVEKNAQSQIIFPWEQPEVNERVITSFNLRLPEPVKFKIEWIVKNSLEYKSMHDFSMKAVIQKIEEELKKLI